MDISRDADVTACDPLPQKGVLCRWGRADAIYKVSRLGLVVSGKTQVRLPPSAHLSLRDVLIYGHCLVTLPRPAQ